MCGMLLFCGLGVSFVATVGALIMHPSNYASKSKFQTNDASLPDNLCHSSIAQGLSVLVALPSRPAMVYRHASSLT